MSSRLRCAIASGKGGVGKTWFSISLACTLARAGRRVLLVDGDLGLANVDVQLGLSPDRDLGTLLDSMETLAQSVTRHVEGGFDVLAGRAGSEQLSSLPASSIERLLLLLGGDQNYDVVLIDLGAGIDRMARRLACWSDTLLLVVTDEPTSLTDAYVFLKVHVGDRRVIGSEDAIDARIIVNQAANHAGGKQTFATLARVSDTYLHYVPSLGGVIRRDDRVRDAIRGQVPSPIRFPLSASSTDVETAAITLLQQQDAKSLRPVREPDLRRGAHSS